MSDISLSYFLVPVLTLDTSMDSKNRQHTEGTHSKKTACTFLKNVTATHMAPFYPNTNSVHVYEIFLIEKKGENITPQK